MSLEILALILMLVIFLGLLWLAFMYAKLTVPAQLTAPPPRRWRWITYLSVRMVLFFIIPGALALVLSGMQIVKIIQSQNWESVQGTVYMSRLEAHPSSILNTYSITIEYRYLINNIPYHSSKVTFSDYRSPDRAEVEALVQKYAPDSPVTIYYDARRPYDPVLERRASPLNYFVWIVTVILLLISTVSAAIYFKAIRLMRVYHASVANNLIAAGNPQLRFSSNEERFR